MDMDEIVAFFYSDGKMMDLNTMIDPASGWHLEIATAINDSGWIVGNGKNKAGQSHALLLTPVLLTQSTAEAPRSLGAASREQDERARGNKVGSAGAPRALPEAAEAKPAQSGFQLWRGGNVIFLPQGLRDGVRADGFFLVRRNGKAPERGLFDVAGKPVAPIWDSDDPDVVDVEAQPEGLAPVFTIRRPGKATITVSVGDWSADVSIEVLTAPVSLGMSAHEVLRWHGYPAAKYEGMPKGCWGIVGGSFTPSMDWEGAPGEYWQYSKWPRCLILVGDGDRVSGIYTRPAEDRKADASQGGKRPSQAPASGPPSGPPTAPSAPDFPTIQRRGVDAAAPAGPIPVATPRSGPIAPGRQRAYVGAVVDDVNDRGRGVRVLVVRPGGPAERAGVRPRDLIVGAGGTRVRQLSELTAVVERASPVIGLRWRCYAAGCRGSSR
jgi:hypothetical protein